MRRFHACALAAASLIALTSPLPAQAPAAASGAVVPVLSLRVRAEQWDWFRAAGDRGAYGMVGVQARAGAAQQRARWGWRLELEAPALLGLPDDALAPAPRGQLGLGAAYWAANDSTTNVASVFLKQAFVRIGAPAARGGHSLRLGRFEFNDGLETTPANATVAAVKRERAAQRLLGNFGWSHVGRSLDGAHYAVDRAGKNATLLLVRPTRGVFDVNGWDELDVTVGYGALTLPVSTRRLAGDVRLFAAHYRDDRDRALANKTDNRAAAARLADRDPIAVTTLGAHWVEAVRPSIGEVDVMLWGAVQAGDWGTQSHRGTAYAAEVGLQPASGFGRLRPWLRLGWYQASGDDDPADGTHGTWFSMLPTPRPFARFPFYTLMNVQDAFASLVLRPTPTLSTRLDVRQLRLTDGADLWYSGGGAFEPNTFGYAGRPAAGLRQLAVVSDLGIDWRLRPRWTASLYGAWADGGVVVKRIYPDRRSASLAYVEVQYAR